MHFIYVCPRPDIHVFVCAHNSIFRRCYIMFQIYMEEIIDLLDASQDPGTKVLFIWFLSVVSWFIMWLC